MKVRVGLVLAVLACLLGQARAEAEGGAERAGTLVYRPEFYNGNAEEESDRLKAQVDMSFEPEFAQFGPRLVLARTLLEVSCGPGHFSERLLGALPRVSIVCVEIDARFIRESRRRLARFGRRFRAIRGDVRKLRGAVGQMGPFDAAVLRLILQHLPGEQESVLQQVMSLLRPETGVAVALDVDSHYSDLLLPATPVADALLGRMNEFRSKQGARPDPFTGRRLRGLLEQTGFVHGRCGLALSSSDDFGPAVLRRAMRETQYEPIANSSELHAARDELHRLVPDRWEGTRLDPQRPLMLSAMFVCTATAPPLQRAFEELPDDQPLPG